MASYLKKEISEWNTTDLCNWLLANKFRGISELFQKYSLSGYDLFYIDDDILKNELNLKSFHERKVALKLIKKLTYEHLKLNVINSNGDNVILTLDNNPETKLGEIADYIGNMFNIDPKDILFKDSTKQEVLSPTVKIVQLLILYPKIYKTLNVSNMKDYRQADEELMESGSGEFPENNNMNSNINMNNNFKSKGSEMGLGSMSGMMASGEMDFQEMNNNKFNNNNYKVKSSNTNMNYRGNNKMKNENFNFNENKKRDENNDNNMKYNKYNNNNYMKMNNKISSNQNNQRQNDNPNDNFLLNSGSDGNAPEQNNKMNLNGSSSNMEYNSMNYRKRNYMVDNEGVEEYQENLNNERRNKSYQYNKRENNEMMDNMMDYNEGNNFGLLSSANDDEMKFKPSYQLKNNENNNNNFRDYDKSKQNYNNL
jgi:hypothetical protein